MKTLKTLLFFSALWILTVAVSGMVAVQYAKAQNLLPPPPVIGMAEPGLARVEIMLAAIERRQKKELEILRAIHVRMFPLKLEQGVMDASTLED